MKLTLSFIFFLISSAIIAQIDTMIVYYKNGHLKSVTPKLNGKQHGKSKMWYESGKIWSEGTWNNGNLIQSTMYYENGKKSYFVCKKKYKIKLKMWHKNGLLWTTSNSKYSRSIEKEFDSTGILIHRIIEKNGSSLTCITPEESETLDSLMYKDGSCVCPWGNAYWRNGSWIDEKGRDLNKKYSYIRIEYYTNGKKKKESSWNRKIKKYFVREWNKNGILTSEKFE